MRRVEAGPSAYPIATAEMFAGYGGLSLSISNSNPAWVAEVDSPRPGSSQRVCPLPPTSGM